MLAWLQRAIKVGRKRERVKDATLQRHRRDLRKRLEEILQLEPEQADGQRLRKRYAKCKEGLLVFVMDREVPSRTTSRRGAQAERDIPQGDERVPFRMGRGILRRRALGHRHRSPARPVALRGHRPDH